MPDTHLIPATFTAAAHALRVATTIGQAALDVAWRGSLARSIGPMDASVVIPDSSPTTEARTATTSVARWSPVSACMIAIAGSRSIAAR